MDWLKCNICFNTYDDSSQRPRSLICGHTFCERCLSNTLLNETLTCPQCRKIHEINSVIDLPINFVVEGLLKSLNICSEDVIEGAVSRPLEEGSNLNDNNDMNDSLKSILEQQEKSLSSQKELLKTSAGMCNEHPNNELIFRCYLHKSWVCEKCIEEQGDHPEHKCKIKKFKEEIEDRKQEHKRSLDNEVRSCNETLSVIERHIHYLSDRKDYHISLVESLQDLVNMHKKEEENIQNEIYFSERKIENCKNVKQRLLDFQVSNLNAATLDESNAVRDLLKTENAVARNWISTCQQEVNECKLKVERSTHLVMTSKASKEYTEKCVLLQKELDKNLNKIEVIEESDKRINSIDDLTEKDITECSLCNKQYDESKHRARNLMCGHFYCQDCLDQIIKSSNRRCPSCRADISASSVETLPPNFLMDDLISKMKTGLQTMSNGMKETKESTISNLKTQKSKREKNINDLQGIITDSKVTIQEHQEEIDRLQKKVNESKQIVDKANAGIRDCKENKSRIQSIHQELISSITINQINQSFQKAENIIRASNSLGISIETNFNINELQDLIEKNSTEFVNKILQGHARVHATAEVNGEKRFAQLVVKNGDVHLPALASGNSPPASNNTVTVSSLLTRYSNTTIYLTLASGGKELGTVYVKLRDSDLARYIRKLCMGTIGPCYRGAKFHYQESKYFRTFNVSKHDTSSCTEPTPAMPSRETFKKGMVCITYETSLVLVVSEAKTHSLPPVGDVINGMSVVEEVHNYPTGQVSITDVGIVLK